MSSFVGRYRHNKRLEGNKDTAILVDFVISIRIFEQFQLFYKFGLIHDVYIEGTTIIESMPQSVPNTAKDFSSGNCARFSDSVF